MGSRGLGLCAVAGGQGVALHSPLVPDQGSSPDGLSLAVHPGPVARPL